MRDRWCILSAAGVVKCHRLRWSSSVCVSTIKTAGSRRRVAPHLMDEVLLFLFLFLFFWRRLFIEVHLNRVTPVPSTPFATVLRRDRLPASLAINQGRDRSFIACLIDRRRLFGGISFILDEGRFINFGWGGGVAKKNHSLAKSAIDSGFRRITSDMKSRKFANNNRLRTRWLVSWKSITLSHDVLQTNWKFDCFHDNTRQHY